ncbi:MAG: cupin domain-containing protein, partial [Candidatus Binatia bacterium]
MAPRTNNIFTGLPQSLGQEQFLALLENESVKIERIVSHSSSSPAGFWYDQPRDEWVIVLRGRATLEFEGGESFEMGEGDYVTIPSHVEHRVAKTDAETIWLAVHI